MPLRVKTALVITAFFISVNAINYILNVHLSYGDFEIVLDRDLLLSALFFLLLEILAAVLFSDFITRPFRKIQEQTSEIENARQRATVLLNAMPLVCHLWNEKYEIFECNDENVNLFQTKDKDELIRNFVKYSPRYQPNGRLSSEMKDVYLKTAFDKGACVAEWMHQLVDGTPLPVEINLVRVVYDGQNIIASYLRDLREQKKMLMEIEQRDKRLDSLNQTAAILFKSEPEEFDRDLYLSMSMIAQSMDLDRVYIWKNFSREKQLYCTRIYEFSERVEPQQGKDTGREVSYGLLPGWEDTLSSNQCINDLVRNMSATEQALFSVQGIQTIFIVPIFLRNTFWGFIGYDECKKERIFSENEISILRSGGIIISNALLRNEMMKKIQTGAAKLKAVIENFPGLIWTADLDHEITLFDGLLPEKINQDPRNITGKKLESYFTGYYSGESVQKGIQCISSTYSEETRDWISELNNFLLHNHSAPMYDNNGRMIGIFGSIIDITELSQLQDDLKKALEEAYRANNAKSDFLANMSHEMRTPLNAIIGLSGLSLDADRLSEETKSNLEKIYDAGETLLTTVNDILDISKIEAGMLKLVSSTYAVPSLINDTITQSVMRIGDKPIKFILDIDKDLPSQLYGDELRIKQIINNLLSNAFKYTREGTVKLEVRCERIGDDVRMTISVEDTGIGITDENIKKLFTNYAQVDTKSNRKIEGTGLGLSITKKLAEMMGGSVSVESEYGKGSIFTVKLLQSFVSDTPVGEEVIASLKGFCYSDTKRKRSSVFVRDKLPDARVLVVDDVITNLEVTKGMMKAYGMKIDCVTSGEEAIRAIREEKNKYDIIFMDHMMPGMDGIEATKIIREEIGTEYARNIPVIALTANAIVGNREKFLKNGFQDFISKPVDVVHLDTILHTWIKNRKRGESGAAAETDSGGTSDGLFNFESGARRFGSEADYLGILELFSKHTLALLEKLRFISLDLHAKQNDGSAPLNDYAVIVHGIKGSSYGICANSAGDEAERLEYAAKTGDFAYLEANTSSFIRMMESLIGDINTALQKAAGEKAPVKTAAFPDSILLSRLLDASCRYDTALMEQTIKELESCEYESGDGLVGWLRGQMDDFEYDAIRERLQVEINHAGNVLAE